MDGSNNSDNNKRPSRFQQQHAKAPMRKQNAISVTLTSDIPDTTTELNEIPIANNEITRKPPPQVAMPLHSSYLEHQAPSSSYSKPRFNVTHVDSPSSDSSSTVIESSRLSTTSETTDSRPTLSCSRDESTITSTTGSAQVTRGENSHRFNTRSNASRNIPNLFFTKKLESVNEPIGENSEALSKVNERGRSSATCMSPRISRGLQSYNQAQYQPQPTSTANTGTMLNTSVVAHESVCRSASTSPRIDRRHYRHNVTAMDHSNQGIGFNLHVPVASPSRKLSLQPFSQQYPTQLLTEYLLVDGKQQQQSVLINNMNTHNNQNGSNTNLSSLTVNNQHLIPRKSVIGQLERSSFQTQRLSDVGVAFGQQITAKMGLKLPASQERIVEQTRWLYLRYIFFKLRQNSLPLRDLNLTKSSRARRAAALGETIAGSLSAPVSAATITSDPSVAPPTGKLARKRTALSQNIDKSDLNKLAAKLRAANFGANDDNVDSSSNGSNDLLASSSTSTNQSGGVSSAPTTRKYLMDPTINNQIFSVIINIIRELRDLKPEFYSDTIYELIGIDKFSSLESLLEVQMTICQEMTRSEISWCRIAALFSLFGAMSLDCVRLGTPEHVGPILDGFIEFVERDLALWISQQGGWESFLYKYQAGYRFGDLATKVIVGLALPVLLWALVSTIIS